MDLFEHVDGYCERLDPSFWAEPINAITNLAFILAAIWAWRVSFGLGRVLAVILGLIGVGSFLFHSFAQVWAGMADVLPIVIYILVYIFAANRDFFGMRLIWALVGTALFIPYAAATIPLWSLIPGLDGSAAYAPVPLLILIYAFILRRNAPQTAKGLAIGAGILILSLTARTLDEPLCNVIPMGTHFLWHCLNGIMLGYMIHVWTRHMLAGGHGPR